MLQDALTFYNPITNSEVCRNSLVMQNIEAFEQIYRDFTEEWLGREWSHSDGKRIPEGLELPLSLRSIYQVFGSVAAFTTAHNLLLPPEELRYQDDYVVFYAENQEVVLWGFCLQDVNLADPMVYQGQETKTGWEWYGENLPISQWVRIMTLWQLVNGGYEFGANAMAIEHVDSILAPRFSDLGGHPDESIHFYGGNGQLICTMKSGTQADIIAACRTQTKLDSLMKSVPLAWELP
jgi:hypothetical protein